MNLTPRMNAGLNLLDRSTTRFPRRTPLASGSSVGRACWTATALLPLLIWGQVALSQQPALTLEQHVAALKASVAASKAILRQYEWVETTTVSLKGEEKSSQMSRCYYGADGKVQKIPLTPPPPEGSKRGIRGRIAEAKREELKDYMKRATTLVQQYVPLEEAKIQAAREAGKISFTPLPNQRIRLTLTDYVSPGDSVALECDLANNRQLQGKISTSLDADNPVVLEVRFDTLDNGASYSSKATLNAPAKDLSVRIQNSGYRKTNSSNQDRTSRQPVNQGEL